MVGSAIIDLPRAFLLVAQEVKAGTFKPKVEAFGLASGVVRYEPNPALDSLVPAALKARVQGGRGLDRRRHPARRAAAGVDAGARRHPPQAARRRHQHRWRLRGEELDVRRRRAPCRSPRSSRYLDEYLRIRECPDERNAVNGLQVENRGLVGGIVAAVDASQATIDGVIAERAGPEGPPPLLLVHHGLFWDGNVAAHRPALPAGRGAARARHRALLRAHPARPASRRSATTSVLAERLGLAVEGWFGDYKGVPIGVWGHAPARLAPRDALVAEVNHALGHERPGRAAHRRRARAGRRASASSPAARAA